MKKILVPTDFSDIAANAFRFAQRIAAKEEATITVMHAHHPSFDYSNPYMDLPAQEFEQVKKDLLNNFMEANTLTSSSGGVDVLPETIIQIGFAAEEITRASKEVDLIVMGTTGEGNLLEKVFGSVSTHVASNAYCPVLLVPGKCDCQGFDNVIYASNNEAADRVMLKEVMSIIGTAPSTIHFVYVDVDEELEAYELRKAEAEEIMREGLSNTKIQKVSIGCDDIQKGIVQYADDKNADLIVTATSHRSFLEKLFHKSVTRDVVFHTTVPLMVLHYDR